MWIRWEQAGSSRFGFAGRIVTIFPRCNGSGFASRGETSFAGSSGSGLAWRKLEAVE
jgi:hypothetical protein